MKKNTLMETSHFLRISSESRRKTEDQTETKRKYETWKQKGEKKT